MVVQVKYVTIATDASVSGDLTCAAWACYIRTPSGTYRNAGILKRLEKYSPLIAETMALVNALTIADKIYDLSQVRVIIYIDNNQVLNVPTKANRKYSHKAEVLAEIEHIFHKINMNHGYEYRHVKAHTRLETQKKYFMNRWCDHNSRRIMREFQRAKQKPVDISE